MTPSQARTVQRLLRVTLDGQVALEGMVDFYDATSWRPDLGTGKQRPGFTVDFSGEILSWRRLPEEIPAAPRQQFGPVRLHLMLPPFAGLRSEPLVCTGRTGVGDLIFIRYDSAGQITIGHDNWGSGATYSAPISVDYSVPHVVELDYGALYPTDSESSWQGPVNRERTIVRWNGQTVLDAPFPHHPSAPDLVVIGANPIGASSAGRNFTGSIEKVERPADPE